jgi:hypothetical protein
MDKEGEESAPILVFSHYNSALASYNTKVRYSLSNSLGGITVVSSLQVDSTH